MSAICLGLSCGGNLTLSSFCPKIILQNKGSTLLTNYFTRVMFYPCFDIPPIDPRSHFSSCGGLPFSHQTGKSSFHTTGTKRRAKPRVKRMRVYVVLPSPRVKPFTLKRRLQAMAGKANPFLSDSEKSAINALDPSLTPLCVSFVGMQECTSYRSFGLYNIEETIDDNLVLHSTVSLQTIAAYGYRPVMV